MPRIEPLPVDQWDPELAEMLDADGSDPLRLGLKRIMAHVPGIAKAHVRFAAALGEHHKLPPRLAEIVRLRIAFHNQCRSCMGIRYRQAIEDGFTEELVCSIERPGLAANLSERERAAAGYADLFATDHLAITDEYMASLAKHFSNEELVSLGVYAAFCVGFGRLGAVWNLTDGLTPAFSGAAGERLTPSSGPAVIMG